LRPIRRGAEDASAQALGVANGDKTPRRFLGLDAQIYQQQWCRTVRFTVPDTNGADALPT
jgi:hypothetical protein